MADEGLPPKITILIAMVCCDGADGEIHGLIAKKKNVNIGLVYLCGSFFKSALVSAPKISISQTLISITMTLL